MDGRATPECRVGSPLAPGASEGTHRLVARDGVELAYREIGDGRPLVLLHGFVGNSLQMIERGPARLLARAGYRVILPDLRGHGASGRPHEPEFYPPDVLARDAFALVEHLGLSSYDLAGYSLGGRVALRMLVGGARPLHAVIAGQGLGLLTDAADRAALNRRAMLALSHGASFRPGTREARLARWVAGSRSDALALAQVLLTHVATPQAEVEKVTTPVLIVTGDADPANASAQELAAIFPRGQYVSIPGDHYQAVQSTVLATSIVDFLSLPI